MVLGGVVCFSLENACMSQHSSPLREILNYGPIISKEWLFLKHGALRLPSAGENHASPFGPLRKNGCFCSGQILSASAHIGAFTGKYDYAVIQFSKRSIWKVFEPYIFKMTLMNFGQPNFWSTENSHQLFIWVWERVGEKESEREIKKREYVGGSYILEHFYEPQRMRAVVCVCVCTQVNCRNLICILLSCNITLPNHALITVRILHVVFIIWLYIAYS